MINENNLAVITYIDENFQENLELDFLYTLRNNAKYNGKIIVLNYGMTNETVCHIKNTYDVEIVECAKDISVFSARYRDIANVLENLEDITHVLICDGGDIWFQESINEIFRLAYDGIACIEEERILGKDEWTNKCIANLQPKFREELLAQVNHTSVKNSGVVCGKKEILKPMLKKIYDDIVKCGFEFFGIDQLYFNYEWCQLTEIKKVILDEIYNYVLVSHKEEYDIMNTGEIFLHNGKKAVIVHNAGGNWRMIKRPFENKKENYEQYVIENIYFFDK